MMRNEGGTSGTRVNWSGTDDDDGDETDASEDISPLVDREAYQAQLQRRAERKGKGRETTVKVSSVDQAYCFSAAVTLLAQAKLSAFRIVSLRSSRRTNPSQIPKRLFAPA